MALAGFDLRRGADLLRRRRGRCSRDEGGLAWSRDQLFWGGGHLLQFVYAALLVTNWSILARMSLGEEAVDDRVFLVSVLLIALIALAGAGVLRGFRAVLGRPA